MRNSAASNFQPANVNAGFEQGFNLKLSARNLKLPEWHPQQLM
jgi:hypothetical protein